MFSTNGTAVVSYRPANRVANVFRVAEQQATLEELRREQSSQDESEAQQLAHQMQHAVSAAKRAERKYKSALKIVADLLLERRAIEEDSARCAGQKLVEVAAVNKSIAEHRGAMVAALEELMSELGKEGADVQCAVAKDIEAVEDETFDRRGLHARTQPRREDGTFAGQE